MKWLSPTQKNCAWSAANTVWIQRYVGQSDNEVLLFSYRGHQAGIYNRQGEITALAWSPDEEMVVSASRFLLTTSLQVWNWNQSGPLFTLADPLQSSCPPLARIHTLLWENDSIVAHACPLPREGAESIVDTYRWRRAASGFFSLEDHTKEEMQISAISVPKR